jgi:cation:H+ antiporter
VIVWIQFVLCTVLILVSGARLAFYGDVIGERTGLGGTWVGLVLMASITSLPELVTGASSMLVFDTPDIAAGDVIGSCMFNLLILALLDAHEPEPLSARIHQGHTLAAAFGIVLLGSVVLALLAGTRAPALGWVGLHSLAFLGVYLLGMRIMFRFERARVAQAAEERAEELRYERVPLRRAVIRYAAFAVVLIGAATVLPYLGEQIARISGLEKSFVGAIFIAGATSLPEVAVSLSAVRLGAVDMAAGNLFGSNLFNIAVLGIDDLLYTKAPLLSVASSSHLISASAASVMTGVAIIGLTVRAGRKRYRLAWDALGMLAVYLMSTVLLYQAH